MVMDDVKKLMFSDGLKWFEKYSQLDVVLETLLNDAEDMNNTWGFGKKNSPIRNYAGGYIAYFLKKYFLAVEMFERAIKSGCFDNVEQLKKDYERIKELLM